MKNTALERWLQMPLLSSPKRLGPDLGRQPFAFRKRSAIKMLTPRLGFLGLCSFQTTEELKTYPKVGFLNVNFVAEDREI